MRKPRCKKVMEKEESGLVWVLKAQARKAFNICQFVFSTGLGLHKRNKNIFPIHSCEKPNLL